MLQPPLAWPAPLFWETLFLGSRISDKAERILTVIYFFLPPGACDAFRWNSGGLKSSFHLTPAHICVFRILFSYGCNQCSSLSTTPMGEEYSAYWISHRQYRQTLARQRWCLPRKGSVYRQRSWKSSNTSVSVWLLLIAPADLGSVWKHRCCKKTLILSSSKWDLWISSTGRRGSFLCVSLLTRDCRVKIFPPWNETVGPVLNQFVRARCSRDSTSFLTSEEHTPLSLQYPCRQFKC